MELLKGTNLPHNIKKVGHCDLNQNLVKVIPLRCLHITYGPCEYYGLHLPGRSLQRRTYISKPPFISMADILTACVLNVGHSDLHPGMFIDPKEANNNIARTS